MVANYPTVQCEKMAVSGLSLNLVGQALSESDRRDIISFLS